MKKIIISMLALAMLIAFSSLTVQGQEWSKEQREVWTNVENLWAVWAAGNIDELMAGFNEKYQGWSADDPLPYSYTMRANAFKSMAGKYSDVEYLLMPARIAVDGDAAVVDYFYKASFNVGEGDRYNMSGRYAEFYVKRDGKWLLLGDFSFDDEEDD